MKDLDKLPDGTKLVWDNPNGVDGRVYYPALKLQTHKVSGALIQFPNTKHWMGTENKSLRFPTEEEQQTLHWDFY
jgi:hypothetical protein